MTDKDRRELLKVLLDLQARVHNRRETAIDHQKAAAERLKATGAKIEEGYVTHWERQAFVHQMVEDMLGKLIEENNVHSRNMLGSGK